MATFTYTFMPGGATGNTPPTQEQLDIAYAGTTLADLVEYENGLQKFTVQIPGVYTITAKGASGGKGSSSAPELARGGFGAIISGTFELKRDDVLYILPGQKGTDTTPLGTGTDGTTGAGGGMSGVVRVVENSEYLLFDTIPVEPLLIAGGGGGGGDGWRAGWHNGHAALLTEGTSDAYLTSSNSGGGFAAANTINTCGQSFLSGAAASQYEYSRNGQSSQAGHGGAGANMDDGSYGGGGAGWRGGTTNIGASSYNSGENQTAILNDENEDGSVELVVDVTVKKLVYDEDTSEYYYYDGTTWQSVGALVTSDDYETYGMEEIVYSTITFTNYRIYGFTADMSDTELHTLINFLPLIQIARRTVNIDLSDKALVSMNLQATEEVRVLISIDGGNIWQAYKSGWQLVDLGDHEEAYADAMTVAEFNAVHRNSWRMLNASGLRVLFLVDVTDDANLTKVYGFNFTYIPTGG